MNTYQEYFTLVEQSINELDLTGKPAELYDPVRYMMSLGGKRLRPVLVLMSNDLFGGNSIDALPAAMAVEVFHNFTLVHDDIMDKAQIRRGKPTVHTKWNETIAILSGDLMMIKATDILLESKTNNLKVLVKQFNQTAIEVCEGQQLDMNFESMDAVTSEAYIGMITLKTAVLLGCSLKLGAMIAGCNEINANHIYEFGKNIGIAFQIQDDILDSFGDGEKTGKKVGGDIVSNKKTLLLIEAFAKANEQETVALNKLLDLKNNDDQKIQAMLALFSQLNVKNKAEELKSSFLKTAFSHLDAIDIEASRKRLLQKTAIDLMERMS